MGHNLAANTYGVSKTLSLQVASSNCKLTIDGNGLQKEVKLGLGQTNK